MKIAIVNTSDSQGGAARAAARLHRGLLDGGQDSTMIVQQKHGDDFSVLGPNSKLQKGLATIRPALDAVPLVCYPKREKLIFSSAILPSPNRLASLNNYSVVNLHWVAGGFMSIHSIGAVRPPVIWTLHDSWAFTGGCHVPFDCTNYVDGCGNCPQLKSAKRNDLSHQIWRRKSKAWMEQKFTIVAGGNWLAACARNSSLFSNTRIEVINPGLDINVFKPLDKNECRRILGLPLDEKLVLFGAMAATADRNKGFQFLQPALKKLAVHLGDEKLRLVIFGASQPKLPIDFGFPARYVGRLHDDISLAVLYSAADVMIVPSVQEAFGQTASESMGCGTPVVAFDATGLKDIVEHQRSGYLARPYNVEDLAFGIKWVLEDSGRWSILSANAREKVVREFSLNLYTERYLSLYRDVIK
jgi:glycosyltransferase involved in cell wall biosynthesis